MERPVAIVLEDEPEPAQLAAKVLAQSGVVVREAATAAAAMDLLKSAPADLVLAGLEAPGFEAARFASRLARVRPAAVLLVLASSRRTRAALDAVRAGAFDVLWKPLDAGRLELSVERGLAQHRLLEEIRRTRAAAREQTGCGRLVGRSDPALALRERLAALAGGDGPVLLVGERGTGKELCARALHELSARRARPFVPVRCSTLPAEAIGAELAAAFAGGGTAYVDDVLALPGSVQDALAAALEGDDPRRARFVGASVREPDQAVAAGHLSEGLRRKLAGAVVRVPPLRERGGDVLLLARHFLEAIAASNELPPLRLSAEAADLLRRHHWPGNVRELRDAIEHAALVCREGKIEVSDLPAGLREAPAAAPFRTPAAFRRSFREAKEETVRSFERAYLLDLMRRHRGKVTEAAAEAGMLRSALQRLLRRHRLRSADFRHPPGLPPEARP